MAAPAAGAADAAGAAEEQTEFEVVLTEIGPNKIPVIKVVRELTGLGLKEAKDVVDAAPKAVKEGVDKKRARYPSATVNENAMKNWLLKNAQPLVGPPRDSTPRL